MQLRKQDVDNKKEAKKKIKEIIRSKPKIVPSPKQKWIPAKIQPKGAALNAKFYKGKKKPSIDVYHSDQESSRTRLAKFRNLHDSEFNRSESHCRRCEACRNKRDALIKRQNEKNKVKEASSANEEEIAEEEKDSFHSQHDADCKQVFNGLSEKLNKAFGK